MFRFRRKHLYLAASFVAVWFLLNVAYLRKLKITGGIPDSLNANLEKGRENDKKMGLNTGGKVWEIPKDMFNKNGKRKRRNFESGEDLELKTIVTAQKHISEDNLPGKLHLDGDENTKHNFAESNLEPPAVDSIIENNGVNNENFIPKIDDILILETLRKIVSKSNKHSTSAAQREIKLDVPDVVDVQSKKLNKQVPDNHGNRKDTFDLTPPNVEPTQLLFENEDNKSLGKLPKGDNQEQPDNIQQHKPGPTENGADATPDDGLTPDERRDIADGKDRHSFNVAASNSIPLDRGLPDFRPDSCPTADRIRGLPETSIIVCFHNEALSTLLRTIHSVVRHTPPSLVAEIILVDDASTYDYLETKLEEALGLIENFDIFIIRLRKRQGIARARMLGVEKAQGSVLVFLDSHCECTSGWLPPLLDAMTYNTKKIVCPEVDIIDHETFEYTRQDELHYGTFDWDLSIVWKPVPKDQLKWRTSPTDPIRTPTMLGGIFAINKNYFHEIGQYDPKMYIWGGENIELSFRVWMCGGSIEILPCSRVGHVFRPVIPYGFPRGNPQAVISYNNQRVAEVWMDEYKAYFYALQKSRRQTSEVMKSVRERHLMRSQLQCQGFLWYLSNVAIDVPVPPIDAEYFGQLRQESSGRCVELISSMLYLSKCVPQHPGQIFHISPTGHFKRGALCVDVTGPQQQLNLTQCTEKTMTCSFNQENNLRCRSPGISDSKPLCFDSFNPSKPLILYRCSSFRQPRQIWKITHHFDLQKLKTRYY